MRIKGPWAREGIDGFLEETRIPLQIACNGPSGHPVLASLWFIPLEGKLWCATQQSARLISILERDPRCAFEVSVEMPPYRGVRGRGMVALHEARGEATLRALIDRYLGSETSSIARFLLSRVEHETALAIEPSTFVSWDYQERMGDVA